MKQLAVISAAIASAMAVFVTTHADAGGKDPASCQVVRMSDVGWTDNQAVNGFAEGILSQLGYKP
jgi:glycine betaine/proline transport system substrate-binding protein